MDTIILAICVLGGAGLVLASVLYVVSRRFAVQEDPRLDTVNDLLPGANCGGCGFPGCSAMAAACVKAADKGSLEGLSCPVGGKAVMDQVAAALGLEAAAEDTTRIAVVRCNGSCENRPHVRIYDGAPTCRIAHATSMGATACAYGCLGCGDCVAKCQFGALTLNTETGLPEVDPGSCTACGACAKACPRNLIEIRSVTNELTGMVVKCRNKDKGILAKNECDVSCIGCRLCMKQCESNAITVEDNLAYIDAAACTLCGKCEQACPRKSIHKIGEWSTPQEAPVEENTTQETLTTKNNTQ